MATSIQLNKVVKRYGAVEVIHGIDLAIDPGEFTVFVGPSGCGKSTLLRMIAGLEPITGGDLVIDGARMNDVPASQRGIAMVFQSYALYPHMTVYKNLAFGLETAGAPRAEIDRKVRQVAGILKIEDYLQRRPKALSGGQRQRVAIGRAIVREPKIFLFDEPLSNLDAELRVQMRVEIAKLHQDLGNTMIYVTHDQVEAMTMADKIVVLRDGLVMQVGAPLDLYNRPANKFVAGFIGSPKMNFLTATLDGAPDRLTVAGEQIRLGKPLAGAAVGAGGLDPGAPLTAVGAGGLGPGAPLAPGAALTFGVRPEHIAVGPGRGEGRRESLGDVTVNLVEHLGGATVLYATTRNGEALTISADGQLTVRHGDVVPLTVDPALCHVFDADGRTLT